MIDFSKKILNSDKFRAPAIHYEQHGYYTSAPEGTTDYYNYWKREADRCLNGYTAPDGDQITGYHYFYLNYSPIMKIVEVKYTDRNGIERTRRERLFKFPDFWDYDWYYYNAIEQAEEEGKHMVVLKARARGYSFKGASMLCRNYFLIPKSKNFAVASEQKYLTGDGLLTKAWQIMDFLDKSSGWAKRRLKATALERTSGFKIKDEITGKEVEDGYLSSITGITLKNDAERLRGTRGKLVLFEEAGKFPDIKQAWQVERPAVETDDGVAFGLLISFGTGGESGADFEGLQDMFYHPEGYNCLGFPNIWDEGMSDKQCGFFVPAWSNLQSDLYPDCMDKDGNTNKKESVKVLMEQREKVRQGQPDETVTDRYIAEHPITPQEAILEVGKNIFPKKQLQMQLSRIRTNKKLASMKHVVDLTWGGDGTVTATEKKGGDITHYPLPLKGGDKPDGSVVIWEYPIKDPPFGLYIAGCLTPGQKVQTQRGLVDVENVTLDDKLINKDGAYVNIKNIQIYEKINEPIYEMKVADSYRTTTFTQEHPIYVTSELGGECRFVKVKDVKPGMYTKIPNVYRNANGHIDTPVQHEDFWWFAGLWIGDGWCDEKRHSVSIVFDATQHCFVNKYFQFLQQLGIKFWHRNRNGAVEVTFIDRNVCEWLACMFGKYALGKRIPECVKQLNVTDRTKFVHGYLDSDGCVYTEKSGRNSMEFVSINLELLEGIQDICFSLDVPGSITKMRSAKCVKICGRNVVQKDCYRLRFGHSGTAALGKLFTNVTRFDDCKLEKIDYDRVLQNHSTHNCICDGDYIYVKIKSITSSKYTGVVYNFECDTHTFMCRCIATHNCDPVDHDGSITNSLASTLIYKRFKAGEAWTDVIVAEYTGRPNTAEEYYENVRKLLMMYNARLLFENERKGIYPYFVNKHCDYLLADQPDKVISEIFKDSKVQRRKGCHMTKQIRQYAEGLIKEWLLEEYAPGHPNLERVYSEPLIEELLLDDGERNVDRVIALCMVMIYREELYQIKIEETKKENKQVEFFEMPLFGAEWWGEEAPTEVDTGIQTFSF